MQTAKRRARGSRVPLGGAVRARPVRGGKRAPHFPLRTARGQMKSGAAEFIHHSALTTGARWARRRERRYSAVRNQTQFLPSRSLVFAEAET